MGFFLDAPDDVSRVESHIAAALREDLGPAGDITSQAIFSAGEAASSIIKCKSPGVLSGVSLLPIIYRQIDPELVLTMRAHDGQRAASGTEICRLHGSIQSILAGERVALNYLQRLSGIATLTARFVAAMQSSPALLLDTRKTTPTLRYLEKRAVQDGGGRNHRFGLYDMVLIKDTHVKAAGGVANAIRKARAFLSGKSLNLRIEAEVQTEEEFLEALEEKPDVIMLDNISAETMARCVAVRDERKSPIKLEASGNVDLQNIAAIAETGVDFISSGSITHSAPALDIHLVIV
jgi:nicotinate-nucleotide pyrophosphorylase (carboxylating)